MSWKLYQDRLRQEDGSNSRRLRRFTAVAVGLVASAGTLLGMLHLDRGGDRKAAPQTVSTGDTALIAGLMEPRFLDEGVAQRRVERDGKIWTVDLTLEPDLKHYIDKVLTRYRVDWAGVAVMDAETGEVLALSSHSEKEPGRSNLALAAVFPAASIFKIVTAAAAVGKKGFTHQSLVRFSGGSTHLHRAEILRPSGREVMNIAEAFAHSANVPFGKLGLHVVGGETLNRYATRFGFNSPIPFEVPVDVSYADIPTDEPFKEAEAAAGFGEVQLSPLHGALLASSIVNGGRLMRPYVVRRVTDESGRLSYSAERRAWLEPMSPQVAKELRMMMTATITNGTARRSFRGIERDSILGRLDIGGKTGSLTGTEPRGRTEWFVGYAQGRERKLAIGIVIVNERYWRIKPALLARDVFRYAFSPHPTLQARAGQSKEVYR